MSRIRMDVKLKYVVNVFLLVIISQNVSAWRHEYIIHNSRGSSLSVPTDIVSLDAVSRSRRDAPVDNSTAPVLANATAAADANATATNVTEVPVSTTLIPTVAVTQIPLLGVNGSGILKINFTENTPKVSDPIVPDDNFTTDFFKETPARIKSEHNLTKIVNDTHMFYNSSFIGNLTYFEEYWANISEPHAEVHNVLSNSHRRATSLQLKFPFPFYGHDIHNITVATGGFIYTGEHVHNWLAATQYIAPLMANFDTTMTKDSVIKLSDDGEKFTAFWENVSLQDEANKTFTFATTLYRNGDIIFAYKDIPIDVLQINDTDHPVKVGISDAYLNENIIFYVRRKTIYEYHRVSFRHYVISNNTILKLTALPTCLPFDNCESCLKHETQFNCTWCPQIKKCSSGTDRNKQDWTMRHCEKSTVRTASECDVSKEGGAPPGNNTAYSTDTTQEPNHNASIETPAGEEAAARGGVGGVGVGGVAPARSAVGGVVVALLAVTLICGAAAWALYAFKNPHTRSGQLLIKYRPSQWSWRRGEARYTAATIHM